MRAHYLQHVPFEGLGSIGPWLEARGAVVTGTNFYDDPPLPRIDEFDLLIVMGGPMSANDEEAFPWIPREKAFIRRVVDAGKAVLGICLGAQMIAASLGERVFPNREKEIGWFPVEGISGQKQEVFPFPPDLKAFHWHGETFDLPAGAVRLCRSRGCENQAFQWGSRVMGLQFHLETTPDSLRSLLDHCRSELVPSAYVQTEEAILAAESAGYAEINRLMGEILSFLTGIP